MLQLLILFASEQSTTIIVVTFVNLRGRWNGIEPTPG